VACWLEKVTPGRPLTDRIRQDLDRKKQEEQSLAAEHQLDQQLKAKEALLAAQQKREEQRKAEQRKSDLLKELLSETARKH
jgi:hypothetical protein